MMRAAWIRSTLLILALLSWPSCSVLVSPADRQDPRSHTVAALLGPAARVQAVSEPVQVPTPSAAPGQAESLRAECQALYEQGDLQAAVDRCEQALSAYRLEGDRQGEGAILTGIGWLYNGLQEYENALASYEQALAVQRETGNRSGEAQALSGLCGVLFALADYEQTVDTCDQAQRIYQDLKDLDGEASALFAVGLARFSQARDSGSSSFAEQALAAYEQALPLFQQAGDRIGESGVLVGIGDVYQLE
jgi:tetratricopeptide (TPR) repeat protein